MSGALLWLAAAAAAAPLHPPEIEAHLAPLVGDWTRAGKQATYRDHCVWYDRRAFVVCSLTDGASGLRVEAIVGYCLTLLLSVLYGYYRRLPLVLAVVLILATLALAACGRGGAPMPGGLGRNGLYPNETPELRARRPPTLIRPPGRRCRRATTGQHKSSGPCSLPAAPTPV